MPGFPSMMDSNITLTSSLATLLENGKYSDLTVVAGLKRYILHRAIVCSQSDFFDGACRNPFKDAQSPIRTIDLTEDDPEAVEHMVHYFYHQDYLERPKSRRNSHRSLRKPSPPRQRARKLNFSTIEDPLLATMAGLQDPLTPPDEQTNQVEMAGSAKYLDSAIMDQVDEDSDESEHAEPNHDDESPHLIIHAKVYAIAEKYGIAGLKALSRKKFAHQVGLHHNSMEFPEACQEAYETTVDSDRGLRDVIIQIFRSHPDLTQRKEMDAVLRETPGLAFELYKMDRGLPVF
ncbi:hypothetical protein GQ43DRAFT_252006 [Delitschia confertaspora ATCC 74209]|uniref:BTB domain-containing protein n=1 Tax=Delitschia confertaspora ATCC 74209 TaxID=1513339 RepID=A0A9P4MV26_9PLEO|nr:hypothetical protein GQ43DRAFT_252006 [Delitschia confertaspora ATCC 74209]